MKPGWKSTEFLLTLAGNVSTILMTISGAMDPKSGAIVLAIANGLYALSRGLAKKSITTSM